MNKSVKNILLTGASGYIGGRLLKLLENEPVNLRCLARNPDYLQPRVNPNTQIIQGDVLDESSLDQALHHIDVAYYLIHSMGSAKGFSETDRQAAENFGRACRRAGVQKIVYLGGLGDNDQPLSEHLQSRQEVGRILRESGVPAIEFRASIVIGSGSLSFELIRALTEKLPVMIMPRWVKIQAQPISIEDLLAYLIEAMYLQVDKSIILEIGGSDKVSYYDLMKEYARQRQLKRLMIPVPVLTPYLSSLWLGLVTPVYARIGRKLIESIVHPTVVSDNRATRYFSIQPKSAGEAIKSALHNEDKEFAETRWSDALSATVQTSGYGGIRMRSRLIDSRIRYVPIPPERAFKPIADIGGENGWYAYNMLWRLRGMLDLMVGGVGLRRGRPKNRTLQTGDTLDFWRVEKYEPPYELKLLAEMRLPGKAWLEFEVIAENNGSTIQQTAVFYPSGLAGLLYWYGIFPLHALVFRTMIRRIARRAMQSG
ncbi:MAG: DUF2867 domain-containing protein [Caldithrix sp.]|nr:DUF2867 domain-containing protein [Caldithrix sp.]